MKKWMLIALVVSACGGARPTFQANGFESVVVFASDGDCPSVKEKVPDVPDVASGWLFDDPNTAPPFLARYCRLDAPDGSWPKRSPADSDLLFTRALGLDTEGKTEGPHYYAEPDYYGLVYTPPQFGPGVDATWSYQQDQFLDAVGAIDVAALEPGPGPRPHLEMIDTSDSGGPGDGTPSADKVRSDHGYALWSIAKTLACRSDTCLVDVRSRSAMHAVATGEIVGSLGDLARAIYLAVRDAADPQRLVINLSLGWIAPGLGGDRGGRVDLSGPRPHERPAAAAVADALRFARCSGATVYAAAGNRSGFLDGYETGLIYPARWESMDVGDCKGYQAASAPPLTLAIPLLRAVGGVTQDGSRMAVARAEGEPGLVAPGLGAVVASKSSPDATPTAMLSGTSVSSLVASVANALIMGQAPNANAQNAEALLLERSRTLDRTSTGGRPGPVRQVNIGELIPTATRRPSGGTPRPAAPGASEPEGTARLSTCKSVNALLRRTEDCETWATGWRSTDEVPYTRPQPAPVGCAGCTLFRSEKTYMLVLTFGEGEKYEPRFLELASQGDPVGYLELPKSDPGTSFEYKLDATGLGDLPAELTARVICADEDASGGFIASVELPVIELK